MEKIRIAICDDEQNIRSLLARLARGQDPTCEITEYADAHACLAEESAYDLLFLDIELDDEQPPESMNGLELARKLRQLPAHRQPLIVPVTGYDSYVYQAFDVEAFQYLVKPVEEERFAETFRRAAERIAASRQLRRKTLLIQSAGISRTVPIHDILYVESQGHKLLLHLKDRSLEYYGRIGQLEQELAGAFARIHKGYLVNLSYVEEYSRNEATLANGEKLMISKRKYDDFVRLHLRFLQQQEETGI